MSDCPKKSDERLRGTKNKSQLNRVTMYISLILNFTITGNVVQIAFLV